MAYQQQPRQPPALNIAAATATATATASDAAVGHHPSTSTFPAEQFQQQQQQQQQQHSHQHPYQHHSTQYYHAPHHHHHHSHHNQGQTFPPIYSAPAIATGASFYGSNNGLSNAFSGSFASHSQQHGGHSPSAQHQTSYGGVAAVHPSASHNGGAMPFALPSASASSQQSQPFSSPASSSNYGGVSTNSNGYIGSNGGAHHQLSAPHSFHSFHQRSGLNDLDSSAAGLTANGSGYEFQHAGIHHGAGLDANSALLSSQGFDSHAMMMLKPKRKQVKNACVNCQKACKRCDEGRPCSRCVKYGLSATCTDSARKERKRGIKRGPYKRRATTGSQPEGYASSLSLTHGGSNGGMGGAPNGMSHSHQHHPQSHHHQYQPHQLSSSPLDHHFKHTMSSDVAVSSVNNEASTAPVTANNAFDGSAVPPTGVAVSNSHAIESGVGADSPTQFASTVARASNGNLGASTPYEGHTTTSPSVYVRDTYSGPLSSSNGPSSSPSIMMQPPSSRHTPNPRSEFDRSTTLSSANSFATSLYNNTPSALIGGGSSLRSGGMNASSAGGQQQYANGTPASLSSNPASGNGTNGSALHRSATVPSLYSPSSLSSSNNGNGASTNGFLNAGSHVATIHAGHGSNHGGIGNAAYQHRMYSSGESSLATLSNGSGTSASTINSPRTPLGSGGSAVHTSSNGDVNALANVTSPSQGFAEGPANTKFSSMGESHHGGHVPSYVHHSTSNTMNSVNSVTAGAFLNPPLSNTGQPFALHIPHSARSRGTANSNAPSFDPSKPRSGQEREGATAPYNEQMPISAADVGPHRGGSTMLNGSDLAPIRSFDASNASLATVTAPRYQLPSPRMGPVESRFRPILKMEANINSGDVVAYGTA